MTEAEVLQIFKDAGAYLKDIFSLLQANTAAIT